MKNKRDCDFNIKSLLLENDLNQRINDTMLLILNEENRDLTIKILTTSINGTHFAESLMQIYNIDSQIANNICKMNVSAFTYESYDSYVKRAEELKK